MAKVKVVHGERDFKLIVGDTTIVFKDGEAEVDSLSEAVKILKEIEEQTGIYKVEEDNQESETPETEDANLEAENSEVGDDKGKKKKKNSKSKE